MMTKQQQKPGEATTEWNYVMTANSCTSNDNKVFPLSYLDLISLVLPLTLFL